MLYYGSYGDGSTPHFFISTNAPPYKNFNLQRPWLVATRILLSFLIVQTKTFCRLHCSLLSFTRLFYSIFVDNTQLDLSPILDFEIVFLTRSFLERSLNNFSEIECVDLRNFFTPTKLLSGFSFCNAKVPLLLHLLDE